MNNNLSRLRSLTINRPSDRSSSPAPSQETQRMITDSITNWSARALAAENELKIERAHRVKTLNELRDEVQSLVQLQATNTARPFGPTPLECLAYFEGLDDGPEKQFLWTKHKEIFEVAMRERAWRETKTEAARLETSRKPAPDSLCAQHEAITDPILRRQFYEQNKEAIHQELSDRRSDTLKLQGEQRLGIHNGEQVKTL